MLNCKSFLGTVDERKHVRRRGDFNNMESRAVIDNFFLQGKAKKEIRANMTETLGEHASSYATVKN